MEDVTNTASESAKDDASFTSPPPSKKLKQARLPFKILPPKTDANAKTANNGAQKKRKLLEGATGPVKAPKTPRSNDKNKAKSTLKGPENELPETVKPASARIRGLLEKFVSTTQKVEEKEEEATIPSVTIVVNLVESDEDQEMKSEGETCKTGDVEEKTEEDQPEVEEKEDVEEEKEEESNDAASEDLALEAMDTLKSPQHIADSLKSPQPNKTKTAKTPISSRKSIGKDEKEKLRKEREEKKQKEKEEKEKQKQEEKDRKDREKEEKLEEKKEKVEAKKKELEEKQKQKEEERKKKVEEKRLEQEKKEKEKERLKEEKELEKQRQKEDKEKAELEKLQVSKKQKSLFQNFFTKKEMDAMQEEKEEDSVPSLFMPFQVKADTRLAPLSRVQDMELQEKIKTFNPLFAAQKTKSLYLKDLKKNKTKLNGSELSTWPISVDDSCCMLLDGEGGQEIPSNAPKKERMKVKLLQFTENHRPAYYGTWQKSSDSVSARRPLGKDTGILDYSVDSDEEWEEEEPGESLSASEDDDKEEEKEEEDEDEDGFFVPHGYLSEGEGCEDEEDDDVTPERLKARQLAKARAFELAQTNTTMKLLKPEVVGCCWDAPGKTLNLMEQVLDQFKMVMLLSSSLPIPVVESREDESIESTQMQANKKDKRKQLLKPVPQEAYPDLVKLVHGNKSGIPKILKEFREFWHIKESGKNSEDEAEATAAESQAPTTTTTGDGDDIDNDSPSTSPPTDNNKTKYSISKRQLEMTVKEIAVYEKRATFLKMCWYVNDDVLAKYALTELPVPTSWQWVTCANPPPPPSLLNPPPTSPMPSNVAPKIDPLNSITKFTVAGLTPKVYEPTPTKAVHVAAEGNGSASQVKSTTASTSRVATMFSKAPPAKSATAAAAATAKTLAPEIATSNIIKLTGEGDDEEDMDCAIVGVELKKVDKNQPSVKSMFRPAGKRKSTAAKADDANTKRKALVTGDNKTSATSLTKMLKKNEKEVVKDKDACQLEKMESAERKAHAKAIVRNKKINTNKTETAAVGVKKPSVVKKRISVGKLPTATNALKEARNKSTESKKFDGKNVQECSIMVKRCCGAGTESSPMEID